MSPQIVSTGNEKCPIKLSLLLGENVRRMQDEIAQGSFTVSNMLVLNRDNPPKYSSEEMISAFTDTGMPETIAVRLVNAAKKGEPLKINFKTIVFESENNKPDIIKYSDFKVVKE